MDALDQEHTLREGVFLSPHHKHRPYACSSANNNRVKLLCTNAAGGRFNDSARRRLELIQTGTNL